MHERITKRRFYELGGLRNPSLFRNQSKRGGWEYYRATDHPAADPAKDYAASYRR